MSRRFNLVPKYFILTILSSFVAWSVRAEPARFDVVATGGAYVDSIATVPAAFVTAEGLPLDGGRAVASDRIHALRAKLGLLVVQPGGMSANTLASLSALGGRAGFFGKIAHDSAGDAFAADFAARDVQWCCDARVDGERSSGQTIALVNDDRRSIAYDAGCSELLTDADFAAFDFRRARTFLVEGSQLISATLGPVVRRAVLRAWPHARIAFTLQSFDEFTDADLARVAPFVVETADVIIGNEREVRAFTGAAPTSPNQTVVITRGARGVLLTAPGRVRVDVPGVAPTTLRSTVGAGDAFAAGYLLGQARGLPPLESVHRGIAAATAVLGEVGGRLPIELRADDPEGRTTAGNP